MKLHKIYDLDGIGAIGKGVAPRSGNLGHPTGILRGYQIFWGTETHGLDVYRAKKNFVFSSANCHQLLILAKLSELSRA